MAYFLATLRSAFGDFSIIDPKVGFDVKDENGNYILGENIVLFTFLINFICNFGLFMIFMNFIIAVISDSYNKVINFASAYDYK